MRISDWSSDVCSSDLYSYTILINGIPIANKNVPYLRNYFAEINSCIPGKGEQQLEIQIYPRYTDLTTQTASLEDGIDFELVIERTAWKDGSLEEPETIYTYSLSEGTYSGQKSFVHTDRSEELRVGKECGSTGRT